MIYKKGNNIEEVWSKHAKISRYGGYSTKTELNNSKDQIILWLKQISSKHKAGKLKALDVGCGIGQYVMASKILGFDVVGLDISKEAVRIAKENNLNVIREDMRKLPFKDNSFDIAIAGGSLEHFPETEVALREIARVLKPRGIFIGNVPNRQSIFVLTKLIQQALGIWKCGYEKSFSKNKLIRIFNKNGLKVIALKPSEWTIGRHAILSKILIFVNNSLKVISLGGPHHYFYAIKN
jgi:ubiquinone/menaquinone biosynthesis C-methylase UbiE